MSTHPNIDDTPRQVIRVPLGTVVILLLVVVGWLVRPASPFWGL